MARDFDNTNTGMIYRNYRREEGSRQPDMTGSINIEGKEYWISGWTKDTKEGGKLDENGVRKFISLAVQPKDEQGGGSRSRRDDDRPSRSRRDDDRRDEPRRESKPAPRGSGFDDMDDDIPF